MAWAASIPVSTHPSEVTVFPAGAKVVRVGQMDLEAGASTVAFRNLPSELDEASVRLEVSGPKGTKFLGLHFGEKFSPETVQKRQRELEAKIRDLEDKKADLTDQMAARQSEMDILKNLGQKDSDQTASGLRGGLKELPDSLAKIGKRLGDLAIANRRDSNKGRAMDDEVNALKRQLGQQGPGSREQKAAEADLELAEAGAVSFRLSYQVPSARWSPVYDVRLKDMEGRPEGVIAMSADVRQNTGEDWSGVNLTLSTVRQTNVSQLPDPTNWWLDYQPPVQAYAPSAGAAAPPAPAAMAFDRSNAKMSLSNFENMGNISLPAEIQFANTLEGNYSISFAIKRSLDIPSDNTSHRVAIAETSHQATLSLMSAPRLQRAAYLQAEVHYQGEQPLLPGPAYLFQGDQYAGQLNMDAVAPGQTFHLSLGQDDQIKVKRELLKQRTGQDFWTSDGARNYDWLITVSNYHRDQREIEVQEQLPKSRQADIKVVPGDMEPKPLEEDKNRPGLQRWVLKLPSGGSQEIHFRYQVKYPSNQRIIGME
jgi:uncharacterized protein (TIGR02231 family)